MIEKSEEVLDKVNSVSVIFMDLSKAFGTLNHDLLIAKSEAYGFSARSLSYMHSYLNKELQITNVYSDFGLSNNFFRNSAWISSGPLLL